MVGTPVKVEGRSRSINSNASSAFHLCMRMILPPAAVSGWTQQLHPVTWNRGTASNEPTSLSPVFLSEPGGGSPASTARCWASRAMVCQKARFNRLETAPRWVSNAPLGRPVVPEV